ncbi:MAG: hypothetical protein PUD60_09765 [Akkermansia muciniphila]|nr:hypothetical protein [Akkermansia muciniphila]
MTEQEFNKRRAAALLAAAHVCPDKLRKVQMLYEAGELMQAANPYGCNQYGHGWKQAHNGISSKKAPKGGSGGKKDEETEKPADQSKKPTKQPNKKPQNKKPTQAPKSPSKPTKAPVSNTQPNVPSKPTYAPQQPNVPGQTPAKPETPSKPTFAPQQKPQAPVKPPTKAPTQVPAGTAPKPQPSKVPAPTPVQQEPKAPATPPTKQPNKAPAPMPSGGAKTPMPTPQQEPVAPVQKTPVIDKTPSTPQQQQPSAGATKPQPAPLQQTAPKPQAQQTQEQKPTPQQKQPAPTQQQQTSEGATKPQTAPGQQYAPQQQTPGEAQQTQPNKAPLKKVPTPQQQAQQPTPQQGQQPAPTQQQQTTPSQQNGQQPNKPQTTKNPTASSQQDIPTAKPTPNSAKQPEQEATNQSQTEQPMSEANKKFAAQAEAKVKQYDKLLSSLDKKIQDAQNQEGSEDLVNKLNGIKDKIKNSRAIAKLAIDLAKEGMDVSKYSKKAWKSPKQYEKEIKDAVDTAKKAATTPPAKQPATPEQQYDAQQNNTQNESTKPTDEAWSHFGETGKVNVSPNDKKIADMIFRQKEVDRWETPSSGELTPKQMTDLRVGRDKILEDGHKEDVMDKFTGLYFKDINAAQSDKNEYDRLSEEDKDVVDTWNEIQNSQIIPEGTILSRGCGSGQFGPEGSMPLLDKFAAGYDLTAKDIAELNAELKKLEGTQFQNPRSSSSAIDPIKTRQFGPIKIEYVAGKGTRGFYVGDRGYCGDETEIVIGNKNIMTIISAKVVDGVPYFVMRVDGIPD